MARYTYPDAADRFRYVPDTRGQALRSAASTYVTIYRDAGATTLADIQTLLGVAIAGSRLQVDAESRIPLFLGEVDSTAPLYAKGDDDAEVYELRTVDAEIAHASAVDPHGDRAFASGLVTTEQNSRVAADAAHVAATDPHGDRAAASSALAAHVTNTANPHAVTAAEVGAANVVVHGSVAATARPSGATVVHWYGTAAPTNAAVGDQWFDTTTAAPLVKRCTVAGTTFVPYGTGTYVPFTDGQGLLRSSAATLVSKLNLGVEDANFTIMGDSTGTTLTLDGWVRTFANWLAAQYPAYTVNYYLWSDGSQNYGAATVIQTGTGTGNGGGPFTLSIYNGSAGGQSPAYSRDRVALQAPAAPDCLLINYGHNLSLSSAAFGLSYMELVCAIRKAYPGTPLIFCSQNPRTSPNTASDIAQKKAYASRMRLLAAREGASYVPVMEAFLADPSGLSALVGSDGIHPTASGFLLWAAEVERFFGAGCPDTLTASRVLAVPTFERDTTIRVPGNTMTASTVVSSFPVVGMANGFVPVMKYNDATGLIGATTGEIYLPPHWGEINVYLIWCPEDTGSANVRWRYDRISTADGTVPAQNNSTGVTAATPGVAFQVVTTTLATNLAPWTNPFTYRIFRDAANGADTYTGIADVLALVIERAA